MRNAWLAQKRLPSISLSEVWRDGGRRKISPNPGPRGAMLLPDTPDPRLRLAKIRGASRNEVGHQLLSIIKGPPGAYRPILTAIYKLCFVVV